MYEADVSQIWCDSIFHQVLYTLPSFLLQVQQGKKDASPCEMKQLGKKCQEFIHEKIKTHFTKQYGALSLETLTNAALALVQSESLARVKL